MKASTGAHSLESGRLGPPPVTLPLCPFPTGSDIAIALHTPPHRAVSLALMAEALGATKSRATSMTKLRATSLGNLKTAFIGAKRALPSSTKADQAPAAVVWPEEDRPFTPAAPLDPGPSTAPSDPGPSTAPAPELRSHTSTKARMASASPSPSPLASAPAPAASEAGPSQLG